MRVLLMANNWAGWQIVRRLREQGDEIAGLVIHPPERQKHGVEIVRESGLPRERLFDATTLGEPQTLDALRALDAEICLSVFFGYIVRRPLLELFPHGAINLHPAYLPYNRGSHPNVWSIVEGTPAGATLHYMDDGVDTGDVIARCEVPVLAEDTGLSLYRRLEHAAVELFSETWPAVREGRAPREPQVADDGTHHRLRDLQRIDCIDLDRRYTARELLDVLRARTFPPYEGAYFLDASGRKIHLQLQLRPAESGKRKPDDAD